MASWDVIIERITGKRVWLNVGSISASGRLVKAIERVTGEKFMVEKWEG